MTMRVFKKPFLGCLFVSGCKFEKNICQWIFENKYNLAVDENAVVKTVEKIKGNSQRCIRQGIADNMFQPYRSDNA